MMKQYNNPTIKAVKFFIFFFFFVGVFFMLPKVTYAATYTVTTACNWSSCAAFTLTPTASDVIWICKNVTVTIDVSNAVVGTLNLGGSNTPCNSSGQGNGTIKFNPSSQLTVSTISQGNGSKNGIIDMTSGGTIIIGGGGISITNTPTFTSGAGTVVINGNFALPSDVAYATFNNLTINSGFTATLSQAIAVNGVLTNNSGTLTAGSNTITMNNAASSISNSGTLTFNGLTIAATPTAQTQYNASYNVTGTLTVLTGVTFAPSGGTITMNNAASSISNSGTLTFNGLTIAATPTAQSQYNAAYFVAGTLMVNSGVTFQPSGGTITMNNSSSIVNNSTSGSNLTFFNLTTAGSAAVSSSSTANGFAVGGTFTIGSGSVFTPAAGDVISGAGTLTGSGTVQVTRTAATADFSSQYSMTTIVLTGLTVEYIADVNQTISALTYNNLLIDPLITAGRTDTFAGAATINGNLTINPTAATTTTLTVTLGGALTLGTSSTTLIEGTTSGLSNLDTSGSNYALTTGVLDIEVGGTCTAEGSTITISGAGTAFIINGNFIPQTSTITYTGVGPTNVAGITYNNLTFNQAATTFSLLNALIATGNLTITAGTLDVTSSNYGITVGGNWANSGTFTPHNGTVTFNGSGTTVISGSTANTFYNLTSLIPGKTISFPTASTTTVTNALTLAGSSGNKLVLISDSGGTKANLTVNGTATVSDTSVTDNNACGGITIVDISGIFSNTACWSTTQPRTGDNVHVTGGVNIRGGSNFKFD